MIDFISKNSLDTPVLFLIFNRPDHSIQVFKQIRKVRPEKLFIAADGPRSNNCQDAESCQKTRDAVLNLIDWDCEVYTLFRSENLGCGVAVSQAISWFFENVEMGIILEDDCFPDVSFFEFCSTLLEKYHSNSDIMSITGLNWQDGKKRNNSSYYFSAYAGIWGWATWRRSWENFLIDVSILHDIDKKIKSSSLFDWEYAAHKNNLNEIKQLNVWGYSWRLLHFYHSGLCIVPNLNLISNIGWGEEGTHTLDENNWRANRKTFSLSTPIKHPKVIKRDIRADKYTAKRIFDSRPRFIDQLKSKIKNRFR